MVRIRGVVLRIDHKARLGFAHVEVEADAVGRTGVPRVLDVVERDRHGSAIDSLSNLYWKSWNSSEGMKIL